MFIKKEKLFLYSNHTDIQGFYSKRFAKSFAKSDIVLLCPIYAAGEKNTRNLA